MGIRRRFGSWVKDEADEAGVDEYRNKKVELMLLR